MSGKPVQINRETVVPLGVVGALVMLLMGAVWGVASDRRDALNAIAVNRSAIERHEVAIHELTERLEYLTAGMQRLEAKLGTTPHGQVADKKPGG